MDTPKNRMAKPSTSTPAPPIVIPGKVLPFLAPCCGKAQSPTVLRTVPEKGYAKVRCGSCGRKLIYEYGTAAAPPRARETDERAVDSTRCPTP